jgi:hypothetical protein
MSRFAEIVSANVERVRAFARVTVITKFSLRGKLFR